MEKFFVSEEKKFNRIGYWLHLAWTVSTKISTSTFLLFEHFVSIYKTNFCCSARQSTSIKARSQTIELEQARAPEELEAKNLGDIV